MQADDKWKSSVLRLSYVIRTSTKLAPLTKNQIRKKIIPIIH